MRDEKIHPPHEDLFAYRDGELGPEKRGVIEAHVMGCSVCRSLVDQVSALEAELRRSPDMAPAGYMEAMADRVRAKVAVAASEVTGASEPEVETSERDRAAAEALAAHGGRADRYGEGGRGRVKDAPKLPWAAVIGTASAAAAVLVVAVILIRQGPYQKIVLPGKGEVTTRQEGMEQKEEDSRAAGQVKNEPEGAPPALVSPPSATKQEQGVGAKEPVAEVGRIAEPAPQAANDLKDQLAKRADEVAAKTRDQATVGLSAGERPQGSAPEEQRREKASAAAPRAMQNQSTIGTGYQEILDRFDLPPVWNAGVIPDALADAEPELRTFYMSGTAGADSARVRLYLAEAVRLRYAPGDTELYDEIQHHYRRVIEMAGPDSDVARVARERLRSLER